VLGVDNHCFTKRKLTTLIKNIAMKDIMDLLGRALMSVIFYFEAYDKLFFMTATRESMNLMGFTNNQNTLIYLAAFCLSFGATLILLGYRAGFGAFLILCYWIPLTFMLNKFWEFPYNDPDRRNIALHFMKNIAMIGGLLMMFANGVGKYSVRRLLATTNVRTFG
jgi:putative oxidoreductase